MKINENKKNIIYIEQCENGIIINNEFNKIKIKKHFNTEFISSVNSILNNIFGDYPINILFYGNGFICEKKGIILIFNNKNYEES